MFTFIVVEVKIVYTYDDENWYADFIGDTFFVVDGLDELFYIIPLPADFLYTIKPLRILKADCEVLR